MSYEKQTWETGDIITADKLNHIEDGIGGESNTGPLIINAIDNKTTDELTLDKTAGEILNTAPNVILVYREENEETVKVQYHLLYRYIVKSNEYNFIFSDIGAFRATSLEEYPKFVIDDSGPGEYA